MQEKSGPNEKEEKPDENNNTKDDSDAYSDFGYVNLDSSTEVVVVVVMLTKNCETVSNPKL